MRGEAETRIFWKDEEEGSPSRVFREMDMISPPVTGVELQIWKVTPRSESVGWWL